MFIKIYTFTNKNINPELFIKISNNIKIILKFHTIQQLDKLLERLRYIKITNAKVFVCDKNKIISNTELKNKVLQSLCTDVKVNLNGIAKLIYNHIDKYETSDYKKLIKELSPVEITDTDALEIIKIIAGF